jgi:hypothetical protein
MECCIIENVGNVQQNALGIPTPASLQDYAFTDHEAFALHVHLLKLYHKHKFICPAAIFLVYLRLDVKPLNHESKKIQDLKFI